METVSDDAVTRLETLAMWLNAIGTAVDMRFAEAGKGNGTYSPGEDVSPGETFYRWACDIRSLVRAVGKKGTKE